MMFEMSLNTLTGRPAFRLFYYFGTWQPMEAISVFLTDPSPKVEIVDEKS